MGNGDCKGSTGMSGTRKVIISYTPQDGVDGDAADEHIFDVLCEFVGEEFVDSVDGYDPARG